MRTQINWQWIQHDCNSSEVMCLHFNWIFSFPCKFCRTTHVFLLLLPFAELISHIPRDTTRNIHHIESLILNLVLCNDRIDLSSLIWQIWYFFLHMYWEMEASLHLRGIQPDAASSCGCHSELTSHLDHSTGLWQKQWHIHHSHAHSSVCLHWHDELWS